MKILVYGLNFAPEPVGVGRYTGEMAARLQAAGHEVRVVTALPYYPEWKVAPQYSGYGYAFEQWQGMPVARAPLWVPFRPGGRKRVLHLLTFAVTTLPLMVRALFWRPDVVWLAAPAFVCAPAALVTAKLTGAKSWIHIQDFEIDIAFGMGLISGSSWKRFIFSCESWLLRRFDHVSTISKAMVARALAKGVPADQISYVPNWADVDAVAPLRGPSPYRAQLNIPNGAVVALYSGSMGVKQGVDWVAEAALALQADANVYVVLCGDGALQAEAQAACGHLPNVRFLPFQPLERLGDLLGLADVHLLPQRADAAEMVMPSKLTGMLASGRPVVGMAVVGTELADVVQSCGVVVAHGDVTAFTQAIRYLAELPLLRGELGRVARAYADRHLAADAVLGRLEADMLALAGDAPPPYEASR
jgi:colanic acid biosynthesis glycosyl transferase WcaI